MAISHKDHNHPNTPQARAACRKLYAANDAVNTLPHVAAVNEAVKQAAKPATWHIKPKGKQPAALKNTKRANTLIKNTADLADVPHGLVYGIKEAWARDLDVRVGDKFRDDEARVVIQADLCEISLVWKVTNPHGVSAVWVRNWDSSKAFRVTSIAEAFSVSETRDLWDEFGNLRIA
jgi:hypothetical protein